MPTAEEAEESYARERLTEFLVAKGVDPGFAWSFVKTSVSSFTRTTPDRHLLIQRHDRIWPAAMGGLDTHWEALANALLSEVPAGARRDPALENEQRAETEHVHRIRGYI